MKDKIKLVFKGILLYTTATIVITAVAMIDSIYEKGYFIPAIILVISLIYACIKTISEEEYNKLTMVREEQEDDIW